MNKYNRTLVLATSAITALGVLPAASLANAAPATEAIAFPESGRYIADMPGQDGVTTTMAITVDGDNVAAYATNGVDDEAYFSGTEENGSIDLTSTYQDHVTGVFDGTTVNGTLTMDDVTQSFAAPWFRLRPACTRRSWVTRAHRGWCDPTRRWWALRT